MQSLIAQQLAQYIHDHTTPEDAIYQRLREETYGQLQDPQMQVGRVEGRFLKMMVQVIGAGRILELGTFSGYSALSMASALPADGMLITCDMDPEVTAVARRYFDESPWGDKIQIRNHPFLVSKKIDSFCNVDDLISHTYEIVVHLKYNVHKPQITRHGLV